MDATTTPRLRDLVVEQLMQALTSFSPPGTKPSLVEIRIDFLVDAFQSALIAGDPARFAQYIANLSVRRMGEGGFLDEMTVALAVIEGTTWEQVVAEADPAAALRQLRDITRTIGAARDQLARSYRAHAHRSQRELEQMLEIVHELAPRAALRLRLSRLAPYCTMVCE